MHASAVKDNRSKKNEARRGRRIRQASLWCPGKGGGFTGTQPGCGRRIHPGRSIAGILIPMVPAYSFLFYCAVQNEQCCHAKNHARAPRFQYLAHSPYAPRTKYGHGEHLGIMPASWRQMFFGCVEKFGRLSRRSLALCVKGLLARPHDRRRLRTNQKSTAMPLRSQSP